MTITKTTSSASVDAYRAGSLIRHDGQWHVVADASRRADDQGGYKHTLNLRPATADAHHFTLHDSGVQGMASDVIEVRARVRQNLFLRREIAR